MDIPDKITTAQLLRDSPHYFIQKVFGYRVDGVHNQILEHLMNERRGLVLVARGHGKSKINQAYITWYILHNPNKRVILVSDSDGKAQSFLRGIKAILESSPVIREFYGDVKGDRWTDHAITIKGRTEIHTEPSLMSIGAGSGAATGLHCNWLIIDDIESFDSARSETKRTRLQDWYKSYQSPVYKTIEHNDPIYKTVTHKDPIYKTIKHSDPIYKTIDHSDPIYETVYSYELRDESWAGDKCYRFYNVYDIDFRYSGTDTWGNKEYTVTVYYYSGNYNNKVYDIVYTIDGWNSQSTNVITGYDTWNEEVITGYNKWSEEVLTGYDTWTEEIITGYNRWDEKVIDYYETKYKMVKS